MIIRKEIIDLLAEANETSAAAALEMYANDLRDEEKLQFSKSMRNAARTLVRPCRSGRPTLNDDRALAEAARLLQDDTCKSERDALLRVVKTQGVAKADQKAAVERLRRKRRKINLPRNVLSGKKRGHVGITKSNEVLTS